MGVRVVFPDMGKDPSVQLIEKTITENGTYDAITDGANGYSKVNVNVEGGGGSSELSIATLTVTNTYNNVVNIKGAFGFDENEMEEGSPTVSLFESATPGNTTRSFKLVLYKGNALINTGVVAKSTSGSIQELGGGVSFLVTGNCSVTV